MKKRYTSLGLMSGTSGDGVDASIINSNGVDEIDIIKEKYFEYDSIIYKEIHKLKEKIFNLNDLDKLSNEITDLERKITIFHAKVVKDINYEDQELVGFHGQTIYHNSDEKISKQLGDGKLLHQLTNKKVVYNFRSNDILNGGEGAPLTPIFHQLIALKKKIILPVCFLNIGGISNITIVKKFNGASQLFSKDIGPGNCLIDNWVRKNSDYTFDKDGNFAMAGTQNQIIYEQAQELYSNRINKKKLSYDISDFDISFIRGLSLEDGVTTLTDFTASILSEELTLCLKNYEKKIKYILISGGGRKNDYLIKKIKEKLPVHLNLKLIDDYNINGDFVESQAFAYLAIRTFLNLPNSFPETTRCKKPCVGGELVEN